MKYLASTKLQPTMRTLYILIFILWSSTSYTQSTKDSLSELQSLLDSIPDISLAELGIDTTAEIVPDTLHLVIPASIKSDTAYARTCLNQAIELIKSSKYDDAYAKADTAKHIYQMNIGYVSKEVADCLHQMGRVLNFFGQIDKSIDLNWKCFYLQFNLFGESNLDLSATINLIGVNNYKKGNYNEAIKFYLKALKIRIKKLGIYHSDIASSYNNLGLSYDEINNYIKAIECYEKSLKIVFYVFGNKHSYVANIYNNLGSIFNSTGEFEKAIEYHLKALELKKENLGSDHPSIAMSYMNLGNSYSYKGEYPKAIDYQQKALEIRIKKFGTDHPDVAASYNNLAVLFETEGEHEKALEFYQKALYIKIKKLGNDHPDVASSFGNIANTYNSVGEYDDAKEYHRKSLDIRIRKLGNNHLDVASSYHNIGNTFMDIGDIAKALEFYQKALDIRIRKLGNDHPSVASSYHNIGNSFMVMGDNAKALEFYQKALDIRIRKLGNDHPDIAASYNNIGNLYELLNENKQAIEFYKKAINIRKNKLSNDHPDIATSYNNLAVVYNDIGETKKAVEFNHKALEIRIKKLGNDHPDVASSYTNLGLAYKENKEFEKAIESLTISLNNCLIRPNYKQLEIATCYNNIGVVFYTKEEYQKALDYHFKALEFRLKKLENAHPKVISSQLNIASTYQKQILFDSSLFYLHQAISGIKSQMSSDISTETKNLYQSQNIPVFESAIEVSLIKSKQDQHDSLKLKTYEYTELAKASLLQSQIKQTDALAFAGIPDSLLHKEYDLRIDINWREKQRQGLLEKGKTETDTTVLRIGSIIFDLKRAQEALFQTLEKDYPEYYRLKYDTKTISLEDTQQKLLQKGQTMLEYFVGDSSIFIFVVRPDTFDVVQVKKDFPLDSLVRQMQSGLYGYYGQSANKRSDIVYKNSILDYSHAANELYKHIMAPVAHLLTPDLVLIPDGVLGYVPFEALLKSKPEKLNQFGTYPYLINDHTISYNYSATLWNEMKNKKHKKEPTKSLVAFAPFYEGSYTVLDSTINLVFDTLPDGRDTTIFQDVVSRKTYAPLPSSGIEAGTVSKLYKGNYFVNNDAIEQKFYDVAGDYRMVHLSTHGVADARQGDYSYLAFAEQKDSIENEFLYVRDIYNTQLNADLVFLSACETAQGELQRGEGIISLARAFAYAGAKSIITTLWQVDDSATKDISIEFYKNLKKGFTKDVALRQAKLSHIKSAKSAHKDPFFWAAMIGIGDMGQVK